jgi:hypothetical protein
MSGVKPFLLLLGFTKPDDLHAIFPLIRIRQSAASKRTPFLLSQRATLIAPLLVFS